MKIEHIGYAVKRIDRALDSFSALGYRFGELVEDTARNVFLAFGEKDGYKIELVSPMDRKLPSPVDTYLGSVGPVPYHICYSVHDLEAEMNALAAKGFKTVVPPEEAVAFGGKRVAFLMSLGIGLMELVEE